MRSPLTIALQHDCVDVVVKKIQQGTYVLPTLMKAIKWKAWNTTAWIVTQHPNVVHADVFKACSVYPLNLSHDTVRNIVDQQSHKDPLAKWLRAMVEWEDEHGPIFTVEQFALKWREPSNGHYVRKSMGMLAQQHRFDVLSLWWDELAKDSDSYRWSTDMWSSVLHTMDSELIQWLLARSSLDETIEYCRSTVHRVQLSLLRDDNHKENADWLWQELLSSFKVDAPQMLSYVAVYDRSTIRTLWSLFKDLEHPIEWVTYFEARIDGRPALAPNPLVDILHSLYTDNISKLNHLRDTFLLGPSNSMDTNFCI